MRRCEREIAEFSEIADVLRRCDTVRIGLRGGEFPYVVPVSFGLTVENGMITIYFHCAREGYKVALMDECPEVCVEGDVFHRVEPTDHGITTRYESVIGFGRAERVEGAAAMTGLQAITAHYGMKDYDITRCRGLSAAAVYKITLSRVTGKRNL